jgi:cytochrome c5
MKIIQLISIALGAALLLGCSSSPGTGVGDISRDNLSAAAPEISSAAVAAQWAASCSLCHASGVGGAPRIGMAQEWRPRLAKGREQLLRHTIDGYKNMPPLGYCMSCEREDFVALIDFMAGVAP